ncbi:MULTISPECIES: prepilin-type N-terminal cleavage/methylation domain-containing protein [Aliivibrio]|uniref:Type II secretion system protein n=1 Tax=Aliivibrio finisterrensis TaxID=511998 RepID=A0A4Q5KXB9_9GAMM|nr:MULTISPECIES: prepilin-type N-terminal cleavage/methylation domain-containing protein [Aliivibrio]MDD9177557.1 type II secretion system protein [Aliivibrio sp. A6]RYU54020.1 type II secretion system protein [Aliivibrio finisterrensis]RYU56207.1 type II secretion system protein [Aliivibrio finisterrensis]RYU60981.1 type II secretion system protein [Aliivibrio finisterrensis]RYU67086.1 type II secretion system protein [Aliivibrio finisterrensis]
MKRQGGFTLIELVVVIVILGILAVTAAPKFLNLQSDARASSLQGLKGAMAGAAGIVYGKAAIEGVESLSTGDTGHKDIEGIAVEFGYPAATSAGIGAAVVGLNEDWVLTPSSSAGTIIATFPSGSTDACHVSYTQAADADTPPVITAAGTDDC